MEIELFLIFFRFVFHIDDYEVGIVKRYVKNLPYDSDDFYFIANAVGKKIKLFYDGKKFDHDEMIKMCLFYMKNDQFPLNEVDGYCDPYSAVYNASVENRRLYVKLAATSNLMDYDYNYRSEEIRRLYLVHLKFNPEDIEFLLQCGYSNIVFQLAVERKIKLPRNLHAQFLRYFEEYDVHYKFFRMMMETMSLAEISDVIDRYSVMPLKSADV